ncbi:unnamed protein product [Symbiodinium sp. CCMP2592]|nr:unnamed protein product [Symbiodinium sp. CCMP2592]
MDVEVTCCCGDVALRIRGTPVSACYCHCNACRRYTKQLFSAMALFSPSAVEVRGTATSYATSADLARFHCARCGSHLYEEGGGLRMVPIAMLAQGTEIPEEVWPRAHIFYENRVVDVRDGLPKYKEFDVDFSKSPPEPQAAMPEGSIRAQPRKLQL